MGAVAGPTGVLDQASIRRSRILVVDDEPANTTLLERLLQRWDFTNVVGITDPTEVVAACAEHPPDLLLVDLQMPGFDGHEVMDQLGPWTRCSTPVPVLVLTADMAGETKRRALAAGARDFITKPFDPDEVRLRVVNLLEMRHLQLGLKEHGERLEVRVAERTRALEGARTEAVERLALAAEYRDDDTHQHAQRIGNTAALLAAGLELPEDTVEVVRRAAPLHDIGKIALSDAILLKPGRLTAGEFNTVKSHALIGARILSGSQSSLLRMAEEIAISHHERWDGNGYPGGLSGEAIPLTGRIVAVADVFDALTHDRPYKAAWSVEDGVAEIANGRGRHFDPSIVDVFEALDHGNVAFPPAA
jgi:putative two-component system response regulator